MTILIVNNSDFSIASTYQADSPAQNTYGGPWGDPGQTTHVALPGGVDVRAAVVASDFSVTQDPTKEDALVAADAQAAGIAQGLLAQQLGADLIAQIFAYNEANLKSGALSSASFVAMMADATMANIERFLGNGSFESALALITADTNLATYFSADQITAMEAAVAAAIVKRG